MSEENLVQKLKRFLETRYKVEYRIDVSPHSIWGEELKWLLYETTWPMKGSCTVEESISGLIFVGSHPTYRIDDALVDHDVRVEEVFQIQDELRDRANWKKYESRLKDLIAVLAWADELAKEVTTKTKVKVEHFIPSAPEDKTFFYSSFEGKGLSGEKKIKKVKRCVSALDMAYRLFNNTDRMHEFIKQYEEKIKKVQT